MTWLRVRYAPMPSRPFRAKAREAELEELTHLHENRSREQRALLLQAWECAFERHSVSYLSGPVTTGKRFLDWYSATGRSLETNPVAYKASLVEHVVEPNSFSIRETARYLRQKKGIQIIEPASLHIVDWGQEDYHTLWKEVVLRFAACLITMDGWGYSGGCVIEVTFALQHGISVRDINNNVLRADDAISCAEAAIARMKTCRAPERILKSLTESVSALKELDARA